MIVNLCILISEDNHNQYLIFYQSTYFEFLIEPYAQQLPKGLLVFSKHHVSFVLILVTGGTSAAIQYHWSVSKRITKSILSLRGHATTTDPLFISLSTIRAQDSGVFFSFT